MNRVVLPFLVAFLVVVAPAAAQEDPHMAKALKVLATTPLIDGHNDLPWAIRQSETAPRDVNAPEHDLRGRTPFMTDIDRLRAGRVGGQFWSVYIPFQATEEGAAKVQLEQIDIAKQIIARYPDVFETALTASDVERVFGGGKIASMLGIEGGHAIENSLGALRAYFDMGVRYMTLTHNGTLDWADALTQLDTVVLDGDTIDNTLGALLKYQDDIARIRGSEAARLLEQVKKEMASLDSVRV